MLTVRQFVSTYNPQNAENGMEILRNYYAVLGFYARHPNAQNTEAVRTLGASKQRVAGWRADSIPDAVRGYEAVRELGWFCGDANTRTEKALSILTIAVFACGSISETRQPRWSPSKPATDGDIWDAITTLGLEPRRGHVSDERPQELTVGEGAALLGRALEAIGVPMGEKTSKSVPPIPEAILEAGEETRRACAELYLAERATAYDDKDTLQIQTRNRSDAYRESVAELLRSLTTERVNVGTNVTISSDAARDLGVT